jgi:hypothetical protein
VSARFGVRRRVRSGRGQALLEVAIASPLLIVLLAGGAQFGSVAFGQITVDTAAREGARTAIANPSSSLGGFFNKAAGPTTMTCQGASSYPNAICQAVLDSPGNYGLLGFDPTKFVITVTANQPAIGPWSRLPGDDIVLASACGGTTVKGSVRMPDGVTPAVNASMSGSGSGVTGTSVNTDNAGKYTLCLTVPSTENVTISAVLAVGGCPETAQVIQSLPPAGTVSGVDLTLGSCSTSTTTTTTSTSTSTTTVTVTSSSVSATPYTCTQAQSDLDGTYVSVRVTYPMPIFVPFVGQLFADSGNAGTRTVSSTVTMRVEPCTATLGH